MSTKAVAEPKAATPAPKSFTPARSLVVQRKCACGGSSGSEGECEECRKKKILQRRAANTHPHSSVPSIVNEVLSSPGRPLDSVTRSFMEPRFGHDFSQVRVHDGPRAAESARAVDAHAYTIGQDIVFDSGRYNPQSTFGRELLAHELTHTVQQRGLQRSTGGIGMPSNIEDQRLEREAEAMASCLAGSVAPRKPISAAPISKAELPVLSRVAKRVNVTTASAYMNTSHQVEADDEYQAGGKKLQSFTVDKLILPATKGPKGAAAYQSLTKAQALQATLDVSNTATKAVLWQERAGTEDLRDRWLQRIGWPAGKDADDLWQKAGGDSEFPKVGSKTCQMDHIVELQVGGNNTNENIQALDATQNRDSGGAIKQEVFQLGQNILNEPALSDGTADQVRLRFKGITVNGTPEKMPAKSKCPPSSPTCLSVEFCAEFVKVPKGKGPAAGTEPYQLRAGGAQTTAEVPNGFAQAKKTQDADISTQSATELIPGFLLSTIHHTAAADMVKAKIDDRPKTRLPITIDDKRGDPVTFDVAKANGKLTLSSSKTAKGIKFSYPYLSVGEITKLGYDDAKGMEFRGRINTKVPFLGQLDVAYEEGRFKLVKDLNEKTLKSPIPGTRITKAELALELWPELKPSGTLAFVMGPKGRELFDAELSVFKDAGGLAAKGTINAHIPGVDEAKGEMLYSAGAWTGGVTVRSDQLKKKFKYIKSGEVTVTFESGKLTPSGSVTLDLPYTEGVTAKLYQKSGRWVFEGDAMIAPPRLNKIGIHVIYDGNMFEGTVAPGPKFKLLGFTGGIEKLTYRNGKFFGTGSMEFEKGKAKGKLTINLLESGKFTGRGDISYQLSENLLVSGSAELDQHEKLHLAGTLKYLKPIELPHTKFGGEKTLFQAGISIPIPGLSLGPAVGLKARIEGELTAGFSVGPAQIRNIEITAAFDPLEDNPNLEVGGTAEFFMPANAHIGGSISAGIMLDLFIGDVTGGLTVRVRADLDGHFKATVQASYSLKRYAMSADFELMLALILVFGIDAFLRARAGWGPFSVSTEKKWVLGEKKIDSGLQFGVRAPLRYASDEPFQAPSWDSIQFIKPTIDFAQLLDRVISSAPADKKEV